jgi:hypothetical protein
VGGPKWDNLPQEKKPEKGLLKLREVLGFPIFVQQKFSHLLQMHHL